jgi:hypothetical protein
MEGRLHRSALSNSGSLDVVIDDIRDGINFFDISWMRHE